jgi:purine-binding chemotaxis protein CheW
LTHDEPRFGASGIEQTAATLRRLFDRSFAAATAPNTERLEDLIAIRVGSDPYAIRVAEIAGLHPALKVVPVPTPAAQLLGVVGLRGSMAPIYDLAGLLRHPPAANPRWIVLVRVPQPVGFAFDTFESHLRVAGADLADDGEADGSPHPTTQHLRGTVRAAGALRPIIHMESVVQMIGGNRS